MQRLRRYIPNGITCLNLLTGCIAIVLALKGEVVTACWLVLLAAVFDFGDGMAARILRAPSEIGKQLDSLGDMVSFGVLPGVIMLKLLERALVGETAVDYNNLTPMLAYGAFLISVFSGLRLAKFNIDTRQTTSFIGLPTPACTLLVASLPLIIANDRFGVAPLILQPATLLVLTVLLSYLLVAELPLFALKFKNLRWGDNKIRFIFVICALVLALALQWAAVPLIILLYILLSIYSLRFSS
jgi:CDP-diacylglycerol--serine O-phosphatidyltransferase